MQEKKLLEIIKYNNKTKKRLNLTTDNSKEYCTGVDWDITDLETLSDTRLLEFVQPCIIENIKRLWHVYCHENNTGLSLYEGILIGLRITEEDCYYILKNGDTIKYFTCVGGICPKYDKP